MKRWMEEFCRMEPSFDRDGLGGGMTVWQPGERFQAAVVAKSVQKTCAAGQPNVQERVVLYYDRDVLLKPGDRVSRGRDGSIFCVIGGARRVPEDSKLRAACVDCERLVHPL